VPDKGIIAKLAAVSAAAILAFSWPQSARGKPVTVSGTLKVTGTTSGPAAGPCGGLSFTQSCPDGECVCVQVPGATISGTATGKVDLSATIDNGEEDSSAGCTPIYLSFSGTARIPVEGITTESGEAFFVQCGNGKLEGGAWGITTSSVGLKGRGIVSGTFDGTHGKVALKLTGTLTLP